MFGKLMATTYFKELDHSLIVKQLLIISETVKLFGSVYQSIFLSVDLTHQSHIILHVHTPQVGAHSLSLSLSFTHTQILSLFHKHSLSPFSITRKHIISLYLPLSLSHTHTLARACVTRR